MQLRATLPVSIFISPNAPLDENGDVIDPNAAAAASDESQDAAQIAPPGYGDHVLDQLYDDDMTGFQTPGGVSGVNSPFYVHSRAGSSENLASMVHGGPVPPADLSSRLAHVSDDPTERNTAFNSTIGLSTLARSEPNSTNLTRSNSGEETPSSGRDSPQHVHIDDPENGLSDMSRVPSYSTAVRTRAPTDTFSLPDYQTALNAPRTPPATDTLNELLTPISEDGTPNEETRPQPNIRPILRMSRHQSEDSAGQRRVHIVQGRDQIV